MLYISESIIYVQTISPSIYFQRAVGVQMPVLLVDALDLGNVRLVGRFHQLLVHCFSFF